MRRSCGSRVCPAILRIRDGDSLESLDHGARGGRLWRWAGFVQNIHLRRGENASHPIDKLQRVGLGPEVYVERMKLVVILILIARVVGREMPFILINRICHHQRDHAVVFVRVANSSLIQVCPSLALCLAVFIWPECRLETLASVKGVLIVRAGVIRDLNAASPLGRVLKQVHIGALVEAMVVRLHVGRGIEIVNVSEAVRSSVNDTVVTGACWTYSVATFSSPGLAAMSPPGPYVSESRDLARPLFAAYYAT